MPGRITRFTGEHSFLSNFSPSYLGKMEGHPIHSVEHGFQAQKTLIQKDRIWILSAHTPGGAKQRGRRIKLRSDWEEIRLEIMESLLRLKFNIPEMRARLLATGDVKLVEGNQWGDRFWGVVDGEGQNWLGKLLMKIRSELLESEAAGE